MSPRYRTPVRQDKYIVQGETKQISEYESGIRSNEHYLSSSENKA